MVDISSIPTDEYGIPKITPQEMVDVLNDLTNFEATTTAEQFRDEASSELERLMNEGYNVNDPIEELDKKIEITTLKLKLTYWGYVVLASVAEEARIQGEAQRRLDEYDDEKDLGKNPSFNLGGCAYVVVGILLISLMLAGIAGSCS